MHIYRNLLHTVNSEVKRSIGFWRLPSAVQAQPGLLQAWLGSKLRTPICLPLKKLLPGFTRFSRVRFLTTKCRKIRYSFCIFCVLVWNFWFFMGATTPSCPPPPDAHGNESIFCRRFARWSCHSPPRPYTRPRPHPGRGVSVTGRLRGKDFLLAYFRSFSAHRPTNNEIHHVRNRSIYIQCLLLQARKPSSVI